jgi:hypothetical protein
MRRVSVVGKVFVVAVELERTLDHARTFAAGMEQPALQVAGSVRA